MSHWASQYIGKPFTRECDCYYWFRRIQEEQFGRSLPLLAGDHCVFKAARLMTRGPGVLGWNRTDTPTDGDAVFLSQRTRAHHIGVYLFLDGTACVVHALEGAGVIKSRHVDLVQNGWKIHAYWTPNHA